MMKTPNWVEAFTEILNRGHESLEWGLPEGWCHAELYRELKMRTEESGWIPFPDETPYVTCYPEKTTESGTGNKWADLCLHTQAGDAWCWFELKARKKVKADLQDKRAQQARDALRNDVAALVGLDVQKTSELWERSTPASNTYSPNVKEFSKTVSTGQHYFAAAFLQLGAGPTRKNWDHKVFLDSLEKWLQQRQKGLQNMSRPALTVENVTETTIGEHSLVLYEWLIEPAT